MSESFSRLKEYDSLSRERQRLSQEIESQEKRLISLKQREQDSLSQLSILKETHVKLQGELQELEDRMKVLTQQRDRWVDQGGEEKKKLSMEEEIAGLEDRGLGVLEELEKNESERSDARTFLEGIGRTIIEIKAEVEAEVQTHREAIANIELRQAGLLEILPPDYKEALNRVLKKNPVHGPFTRIDSGSCFLCRYKISRVDESEIDMQKKLKHCPQCGRIFIPYGT